MIFDPWAALQFDSAVVLLGTILENAAQEQVKTGTDSAPKWEHRYTLAQLLTPGFTLGPAQGDELPVGADGLIYDEVS